MGLSDKGDIVLLGYSVRNSRPSCRLTTESSDITNPSESELLTALRAIAGGHEGELRLDRGDDEFLSARSGRELGMLKVAKGKGQGRGEFRSRSQLPVTSAEQVFSAYLAGDHDFDRGMKWHPVALSWVTGPARLALLIALLVALFAVLLHFLGVRLSFAG